MILLLWLTLVWVGLWGSPSPANVLGGLLVGLVLLRALPLEPVRSPGRFSPLGALRFTAVFLMALVQSSVQVLVLVLRRRPDPHSAVIAVPVRGGGGASPRNSTWARRVGRTLAVGRFAVGGRAGAGKSRKRPAGAASARHVREVVAADACGRQQR